MSTPVSLSFEFSKPEFHAAQRACLRRSRGFQFVLAATLLLCGAGFVLAFTQDGDRGLMTLALFYLLSLGIWHWFLPIWRWRKEPLIRGTQQYAIDDAGARFVTPISNSHVDWSFFKRGVEYDTFYLLLCARRGGSPIPKRAFSGSEDERRFREIVGRHLPTRFHS
jgi:YcxB-like protein